MPLTARKFSGTLVVGEAQFQSTELENDLIPFWNFPDSSLFNSFLPSSSHACARTPKYVNKRNLAPDHHNQTCACALTYS